MPVINLIQEQRLAHHKMEQRTRIAFMTLFASALASAFAYGIVFFQGQALNTEKSRLETDLQRTRPVVEQIEANQRAQDSLLPQLNALQEAAKQSDRWARILKHLSTQTPSETWLTGLQATALQADKPTSLVLQGAAKAQQPIGEFALRVENDPDLDNVALHFTREKPGNNAKKSVDFEIAADLTGTEEQKKSTKEETKS